MNLDQLILDINDVSMEGLVTQAQIQTKADIKRYWEKGYMVEITAKEFRETFGLDPKHVSFTGSMSCPMLYFNRDTLAVCNFPMYKDGEGEYMFTPAKLREFVAHCEALVEKREFMQMLLCLPDGLKFPYFTMMLEKYGEEIPNLYSLFMSTYTTSDYGFKGLSPKVLEAVYAAKTDADKAETAEAIADLPDIVTVYRGEGSASTPYTEACSWTTDIPVAYFFACRRGKNNSRVITGLVAKEDILEYDPDGEAEVLVLPGKVKDPCVLTLYGMDELELYIPILAKKFSQYRDKAKKLKFNMKDGPHGIAHTLRVLLLSMILCAGSGIDTWVMDAICEAAIFHDTRRENDYEDPEHGARASAYCYECDDRSYLLTRLLCEYHCKPDEEGYTAIRNSYQSTRRQKQALLAFDIFKDADALDRVRFGLRDLDESQLRTETAMRMPHLARLLYDGYKFEEE